MNYTSVILNRLIDIYEQRGLFFAADSKKHQGIYLSVEKVFSEYTDSYKGYFHKGDIDVYGFVILENLKKKTGIPFLPLEMDLETLKEFESYHLVKPLNASDRKMLHIPQLAPHQNILTYMERHDCKAEQESRQALRLLCKE